MSVLVKVAYWWAKTLGLAPFSLSNGRVVRGSILDRCYPLMLIACYIPLCARAMSDKPRITLMAASNLSKVSGIVFQCGISVACITLWLLFTYKHEQVIGIFDAFHSVDQSLIRLGVRLDYEKALRRAGIQAILIVTVNMVSDSISHALMSDSLSYDVVFWRIYNSTYLGRQCTVFMFVHGLLSVKQRFRIINEKFFEVCSIGATSETQRPPRCSVFVVRERGDGDKEVRDVNRTRDQVKLIKELHGDLCDLTENINDLFSVPLLLIITLYFLGLLTDTWYIYRALFECWVFGMVIAPGQLYWTAMTMVKMIVLLIAISVASTTTCLTGNDLIAVLNNVWITFRPTELQNQVKVAAWGAELACGRCQSNRY